MSWVMRTEVANGGHSKNQQEHGSPVVPIAGLSAPEPRLQGRALSGHCAVGASGQGRLWGRTHCQGIRAICVLESSLWLGNHQLLAVR